MTRYGPFAETTPGGQTGWIDDFFRPVPDHLLRMMGHLDGAGKYTYIMWRGVDPESIVVRPEDSSSFFIQAADSAEQMVVEVRLPGPDGEGHLYAVGRPQPAEGTTTLVPISDERAVEAFSNELFTADEAAAVFYEYYQADTIGEPYVLRELDLSQELSVMRRGR